MLPVLFLTGKLASEGFILMLYAEWKTNKRAELEFSDRHL